MTQNKKLLIVFDLVATLTDAAPRYVKAFEQVCVRFGYPAPDPEEISAMLGNKNLKEIMAHFLGDIDDDLQSLFMSSCNEECDAMLFRPDWQEELFPHVKETLEQLGQSGFQLGIYTGTRENALNDQIHYHKIDHLFSKSYLRGKDNKRDADLDSKSLKAQQLSSLVDCFRQQTGDKNAPVLVIGDSEADFKAAQQMGFLFIGFAASPRKKQRLHATGIQTVMTDFSDLPLLIKTSFAKDEPTTPDYQQLKKKHPPKR